MSWARLDDNFPLHPKVIQAGPLAAYLFVCGLCYCRKFQTGGFIPQAIVKTLGATTTPKRLIAALVDVGLWTVADDGYQVHGYDEIYDDGLTKAEREIRLQQKRDAGRKGGLARSIIAKHNPSTIQADFKQKPKHQIQAHKVMVSDPVSDPDPDSDPEKERKIVTLDVEFLQFQQAFPAKGRRGGPMVEGLFQQARASGVTLADMLSALANHCESDQWRDGKIQSMLTWFEQQLWLSRLPSSKAPDDVRTDDYGHSPPCATYQECIERVIREGREARSK